MLSLQTASFTSLFFEARLSPAPACRAWTEAQGCFTGVEWHSAIEAMPLIRKFFEEARLAASEVLGVEGIDRLGIFRKLMLHESTGGLSRSWLRDLGFVHLDAASGIHLYCLWTAVDKTLMRFSSQLKFSLSAIRLSRGVIPFFFFVFLWGFTGFRPGLLRPFLLVLFRLCSSRLGIRFRWAVPLVSALLVDALFGFFHAYGSEFEFDRWAPGELHYALSWWGGVFGFEWARARGWSGARAHLCLGISSWFSILPLDLWIGHFAPWTPVLSFITVEFLVRGGFLLLFLGVLLSGFFPNNAWATHSLEWMSLGWNAAFGSIGGILSEWGGDRNLDETLGVFLSAFCAILIVLAWMGRTRHSPDEAMNV
ncbi:MAG: hypothetical protein H7301_12960 [Cryobacterium sp.]|nr:hypothetical protein [Oligoflexia bacterium]